MDQANNESSSRPAVSAWQVEVVIKEEEVRRHNQVSDAWISFNGAVYDITKYVHRHPPCPGPGSCMIFTSTAGLSDLSSFFCPWFRIDQGHEAHHFKYGAIY
jgi:cytochrome b involved in lipid metabolism